MLTIRLFTITILSVLFLFNLAFAQGPTQNAASQSGPTVTAAATSERVRFTAPSTVVQMRLEVYSANGEKLFDNEVRGGNVIDWHLQNGQGNRLAADAYLSVVSTKSLSGRITQKLGRVTVGQNVASVQTIAATDLTAQQSQAIGPLESDSAISVMGEDINQTPTVVASDGTDGQMIRGRGALSFRIGNFFNGDDQEQMRLTEAGDLGLGTSEPKAKLDVAGTIRAQRFLLVKPPDNTVGKTAQASDGAAAPGTVESVQPLASGTGTQYQIAKWTDNSGTLGDSMITETAANNVGIGTTIPSYKFVVQSPSTGVLSSVGAFRDSAATGNELLVRTGTGQVDLLATWEAPGSATDLSFTTTTGAGVQTEKMRVMNTGQVGIGTATPTDKLEVQDGSIATYHPNSSTGSGFLVNFYTNTIGAAKNTVGSVGAVQQQTNTRTGAFVVNLSNGGPPSEKLRIDKLGNVGIGTNSPVSGLDILSNTVMSAGWNRNLLLKSTFPVMVFHSTFGSGSFAGIGYDTTGPGLAFWNNASSVDVGASTPVMYLRSGNLGIGTTAPNTALDLSGALSVRGTSAPALSPPGQGRIYFDNGSNTFKASQNGAAYADLLGGGGGSLTLPYSNTTNSASTLFDITNSNSGSGLTASFTTSGAGNSGNTVKITHHGGNTAGAALSIETNNAGILINNVDSGGQGDALAASTSNNTTGAAIHGANNFAATDATKGRAGLFEINAGSSGGIALETRTSGAGATAAAFLANVMNNGNFQKAPNIAIFQAGSLNVARIDNAGKGFFNGGTAASGADLAELFDVEGARNTYEPGDVLVISTTTDRTVVKSSTPYSTLVAGVYATKPGVTLSELHIDADTSRMVPMGVIGVIPTKVCDENGAIHRGDLLVTSSREGYAMRGTDRDRMFGAIIGKALEDFEGKDMGVIKVLVSVK